MVRTHGVKHTHTHTQLLTHTQILTLTLTLTPASPLLTVSFALDHYIGDRADVVSADSGPYLPGGGPLQDGSRLSEHGEELFASRRAGKEAKWADGVLLCRVVERLERMRGKIPGSVEHPRTRAHALNNVRRAVDVLERSGRFRSGYFYEQEDLETALLEGRRRETMGLFADMRKVYAGRS